MSSQPFDQSRALSGPAVLFAALIHDLLGHGSHGFGNGGVETEKGDRTWSSRRGKFCALARQQLADWK